MMNNIKLAEGVYYVGAVDWNLRDFHGFTTPRGVTYNAYLVVDEKICLIDNVKAPFAEEMIERISQIIDPAKIDYVITNHVEPDHSGSLPKLMERAPHAKVVLTESGRVETLKHYQQEYDFQVVKEGDVISLGRNKLHFVPFPMLHWPDSMATYLDGEQILFSNDAFGQHICTAKRFDFENDLNEIMYEASKYYANILMPFGKLVDKALSKAAQLPIKMIAPSHGVIWQKHIADIIAQYDKWGKGYTADKVVIIYESLWGGTEQMARRILDGVAAGGVDVKLMRLSACTLSGVMQEVLEARGILFGSPTQNNGMMATMGALMTYFKGLRPTNKIAASFGTFGWGGGAQQAFEEQMKGARLTIEPGLTLKWLPDQVERDKCFTFGLEFAKKVLAAK
ncbi:MAG: FprA family A-type flavoprotein [Pelosinus sp.]|nr:FprA family A-type flavoprotein [Pelosinus sp.]